MYENCYVLDTNIWISYFLSGRLNEFYQSVVKKRIKIFTSENLIEEIAEVLHRKKVAKYLIGFKEDYIDFHKSVCVTIHPRPAGIQLPDPDDDFLIDLAIEAKAKSIVTGDKKLLAVRKVSTVRFQSFSSFKKELVS